ncbi:MAG: YkgJ family cysteine cluster protein [Methanobacteriota archaeon]
MGDADVDWSEIHGRRFACLPGCGYCCLFPAHLTKDERRDPVLREGLDAGGGSLRLMGPSGPCAFLRDRACTVYAHRPSVCRTFPFQFHAGGRVQANMHRICPGTHEATGEPAEILARRLLDDLLQRPHERAEVAAARKNWVEFERRMRAMREPAREELAPALAERAADLVAEEAEALDAPEAVIAAVPNVEDGAAPMPGPAPDHAWREIVRVAGGLAVRRIGDDGRAAPERIVRPADLPRRAPDGAEAAVAKYVAGLLSRDHVWGAAARAVDGSGYRSSRAEELEGLLRSVAARTVARTLVLGGPGAAGPAVEAALRQADVDVLALPTIGAVLR